MPAARRARSEQVDCARATARDGVVEVRDTVLYVERRGRGHPLLLIHGAGEDAGLMRPQAESLAAAGCQVLTYDRRGTGHSGRDAWPGLGAYQHARDAADLIELFGVAPVVVLGVGTGGVIALALAISRPELVASAVLWEAPAVGVVPECAAEVARLRELTGDYLTNRPGDYCGAQTILLAKLHGSPVTVADPEYARVRVNAEPMVRDDLTIALTDFGASVDAPAVLATSAAPGPCTAKAMDELGRRTGTPVLRLPGPRDLYRTETAHLTGLVRSALPAW